MNKIERLRQYLGKASFGSETDRFSALECLEEIAREIGLGPKHKGMRISADGLLGRLENGKRADRMDRWMLGQLLKHMQELGRRYYSGDMRATDEFLQLYCCDDLRPSPDAPNERKDE